MIRKIPPAMEHSVGALAKASEMLEDAKANFGEGRFDSAAIIAYASMLNAGRAVLFRDGYTEKSHYCVARYLEETYSGKMDRGMVSKLDSFRQTRHEAQYSPTQHVGESEAGEMVGFAGKFLEKIEGILKA
jgi:uncharacterized protein (UPF0332 family)